MITPARLLFVARAVDPSRRELTQTSNPGSPIPAAGSREKQSRWMKIFGNAEGKRSGNRRGSPTQVANLYAVPIAVLGEFAQQHLIQANAGFEILDREVLVRRMYSAIRQPETEQQCFRTEHISEGSYDWNASASANECSFLGHPKRPRRFTIDISFSIFWLRDAALAKRFNNPIRSILAPSN
jgi:hypothetical protein